MDNKFLKELDELYSQIEGILNDYTKSTILQNHFLDQLKTLFYANLINNFFINLNKENIKECNLPRGKISIIKKRYNDIQKDIKSALSTSSKNKKIDEKFYKNFRLSLRKKFPEFLKIIIELEKVFNIKKVEKDLIEKEKKIKELGKLDSDFNAFFITKALEVYVEKENRFPVGKELDTIMKTIAKKGLPEFSKEVMKTLHRNSKKMLNSQRTELKQFEDRHYMRWKEPLDLLECLIRVSQESGKEHKNKLSETSDNKNNFKREALIKIHARSLQISNEILVLLKSGYADGANARWRSLRELAVISFFLLDNNNDVSKRYLDHEIISRSNQAESYMNSYKKLGYKPLRKKELDKIQSRKKAMINKYGNYFKNDYGWIPKSLWPKGSRGVGLSFLEKQTNLSHLNPFYKSACDSLHGGSRGFYSLGLMNEYQDKILLVGPSNYGLADPLQNTAISVLHTTISLLSLKPDFENILSMQIINNYVKEIGEKAVEVQKNIEKEESSKT